MSKDLATRIYSQINHFENFTQFTELLKTKELTYTRIQRALLHTILKIREQPKGIPYARVLGFRKSSSPLLKEIKQHTTIPVITKAADALGILSADGQKIWNDNLRASNILLFMNIKNSWSFYRASCPFILTESDFILNPKHYFTLTALAAE